MSEDWLRRIAAAIGTTALVYASVTGDAFQQMAFTLGGILVLFLALVGDVDL